MFGTQRFSAILLACAALAACAGGGSRAVSPPVQPKAAAKATVTATLRIPAVKRAVHGRRTPLWIPASAQGVALTFWPQGAAQPAAANAVFDVSATSALCTSDNTGRNCVLTIAVPPGPINVLMVLYDAKPSAGAAQGTALASGSATATIVANTSNALSIVAFGIPASLAVTPVAITSGVASDVTPLVIVADAAGDIILTDSYDSPITVTVNGAGGAITPASIDLSAPADAATFHYDGTAIVGQPSFSASGGSASGASTIVMRPSPTPSPTPSPVPLGPLTVACSAGCTGLANGSTPYALTISRSGYGNGAFTLTGGGSSCAFDPPATTNASNDSATVNVYPNPQGGTCTLSVTDADADAATATMSFNEATNPTAGGTCPSAIPPDPNGGFLYLYNGCAAPVMWGSYTYAPLMSNQNPFSFQLAIYANTTQQPVRQFTVNGNRYITSVSVSAATVDYVGQGGTSSIPFASLVP